MVNPDSKALSTTPLLAVRIHANDNIALSGTAIAEFTLPKEQVGGRGFAIQLFDETTRRRHLQEHFIGSYAQSTLDGTTLRFVFTPPPVTVKKGETWLFVLYGDERPDITPGPSSAPSASPSASPKASASGSPSSAP
jgi:hypothetical protein